MLTDVSQAEADTGTGGRAEQADVVIAGGGPVGLMLAIELRLGGATPVVLERLPAISEIPKGNGLVGQIVLALDYRGLLEPMRAESTYAGPVPAFSFGPLSLDLSGLGESPLHVLAIPQRRLEHVLASRLAELGGSVRRGHELTGFTAAGDAVTVSVAGPDGSSYQIRAGYLAGCDGAHSQVRKQAGIAFPGFTSAEISRIGRVTLPGARLRAGTGEIDVPGAGRVRALQQIRTAAGMFSIGPLASLDAAAAPDAFIVWTREDAPAAGDVQAGPMTLADLRASLLRVTGADVPMTDPQWLTSLASNSRVAESYQAGRVLLAGDAAHVFGVGGSLNTGLLDALNLGWKLAAEAGSRAPAGLLGSYQAERHEAARRTLMHTRAQRALTGGSETAGALRDLLAELIAYPDVRRHLGELIEGSDLRYDAPAGATGRHQLAGRLAPDYRVVTADGTRTRIAELMRGARPVLLDFTPDGRAAAAAAGWSELVPALRVTPQDGNAAADAVLIRPDGIVAWAAGPRAADPAGGLAGALAALAGSASLTGAARVGRGRRYRVRLGAAVAPVPAGVDLARVPQVPPVKVREQGVQEHHLGIRGLPEQEVGRPLLPR